MSAPSRVLVVDDEPQIRRVVKTALVSNGYETFEARTGEEAVDIVKLQKPDLILLDMNMPGMGGMATCRQLRTISDAAIIVLSVRDGERDKIEALDSGADDYITKPFSVDELLARMRANLRRLPAQDDGAVFTIPGELSVDFVKRQVIAHGQEIRLTPKEFDLLHFLLSHADRPVTHRKLLQTIWGPDYGGEVEYLRVFVRQLRKKIERDPAHPRLILTEPWVGYRFAMPKT
ncbi:MAG: response regulator transcription factor [Acidobacteriaceae bacterium]|nr:response regulator transcription factor [Acidobacteriaceae bacterium]MBV8570031.1 response regulator transcription factor [Acidobacteriaceae bacterium]